MATNSFTQLGNKLVGTVVAGQGGSQQGYSVCISGDGNTMAVGAPVDNDNLGAVWVYTKVNGSWSQQDKIVASNYRRNSASSVMQGYSVTLSYDGDTLAFGGPFDKDILYGQRGATWVYTRSNGVWTQQQKLVGTGTVLNGTNPAQGYNVALSSDGNTLAVSNIYDDNGKGATWIFVRSGTTWSQEGNKLIASDYVGTSAQGKSLALSSDGNTLAVSSNTDGADQIGATWIFTRSGTTWAQQGNKLVGSLNSADSNILPYQGDSVALSSDGNTLAVGGSNYNDIGATWIFTRSGTTWSQQGDNLTGTGYIGYPQQGTSVALSSDGNTLAFGGSNDDSYNGAAWIFTRSGTTWTQDGSKLVGSGNIGSSQQGKSVSLSSDGNTLVVGGYADNDDGSTGPIGAVWVFSRSVGSSGTGGSGSGSSSGGSSGTGSSGSGTGSSGSGTGSSGSGTGSSGSSGSSSGSGSGSSSGGSSGSSSGGSSGTGSSGSGTGSSGSSTPNVNDVSTIINTGLFLVDGGIALHSSGDIYFCDTNTQQIYKVTPSGTMSVFVSSTAGLNAPKGLTIINDTLYVCDQGNYRVVSIDLSGTITVVAGGANGITNGNGSNASFVGPTFITSDNSGNLYITDYGTNAGNSTVYAMVKKIDTSRNVTTLVGGARFSPFNGLSSITCDSDNNIYVVDPNASNLYKITQAGTYTAYNIGSLGGITIDSSNNLYATKDYTIVKINTTDFTSTTIAGSTSGYSDANGTTALFNSPSTITYNTQSGSLFIIDRNTSSTIRKMITTTSPSTSTTTSTTTTSTTSTTNTSTTNIDFVLDAFDGDLAMSVKALLHTGQPHVTITADATAVYEVSTSAMKDAFYFQSDSRDMSNDAASDIKYFVNWPSSYVLNPAHAYVDTTPISITDARGTIPENRLLVKHDFIRHIAKSLFNTHLGVDLFSNEAEVVEDIASKGHDAWTNNIKPAIDAVSNGGTLAPLGYTTNALDTSANLCKVLFKQITSMDKNRFSVMDTIVKDASNNHFYMPFKGGDSISFKVVLKSEGTQESIIGGTTKVPDRSYQIKIKIVDTTPSNVVVDDGAFTSSRVVV